MHPLIVPARATLELNGALFLNALDGLDDATGRRTVGRSARRIDHVAAHLLDARGSLGTLVGLDVRHDLMAVLAEASSFEALGDHAPLSAVRAAWVDLSPALTARLESLDPVQLTEPSSHAYPISDRSLLGAVTFLLQHESYHLGQLGLLRRELGFPAVLYPVVERR